MTADIFNILAPSITQSLGAQITYAPPGGVAGAPFLAVWDRDFRIITLADGIEIEGRTIAAHVARADVPDPAHDAVIAKDGVSYKVYEKQENGPGMWTLLLEKS